MTPRNTMCTKYLFSSIIFSMSSDVTFLKASDGLSRASYSAGDKTGLQVKNMIDQNGNHWAKSSHRAPGKKAKTHREGLTEEAGQSSGTCISDPSPGVHFLPGPLSLLLLLRASASIFQLTRTTEQ